MWLKPLQASPASPHPRHTRSSHTTSLSAGCSLIALAEAWRIIEKNVQFIYLSGCFRQPKPAGSSLSGARKHRNCAAHSCKPEQRGSERSALGSSLTEAEMLCRALVVASSREGKFRKTSPFCRAHLTVKRPQTDFRNLQ